jgi:Lipoprotein LpqB beta-propeller domain
MDSHRSMITSRIGHRVAAAAGGLRRPGAGGRAAVTGLVLAITAAGCATVPTNGPVQQVGSGQAGVSQEQDYPQPIPTGPQPGSNPEDIVDGFLAASASFADDHAVAREYLDPAAQQNWRPGWAVTVVSSPTTTPAPLLPRPVSNQPEQLSRVKVTGQPVATLTNSGQYLVSSGPRSEFYFLLRKINGQWRIDQLPTTSQLLLTETDFQGVYQPRDLYFLAPSGHTLVPDPVFVPQQATNTELATGLVTALLQDPQGWLAGAAATGFPARTKLIGQVIINGPNANATVDLGGGAASADRRQLGQMAAQLAWTLASGPTPIQSVELQLNNRPLQINGSPFQLLQTYHAWVPAQGSSLYFIGGDGAVQTLSGAGQLGSGQLEHVSAVPGAAGAASVPAFSSIAVSADGRSVAGISNGGGAVYTSALAAGAVLGQWRPTPTSRKCTSVSWDAQGNLWIAAGGDVWVVPSSSSAPLSADEEVSLGNLPPTDQVTDFQVAPDGVRVVMIVRRVSDGGPDTQVQLAAITQNGPSPYVGQPVTIGAGIADPEAVTWYGADWVIVLAGGTSGAQLYKVPLNGGQPTLITTPGAPVSVAATSPEGSTPLVAVGLPGGKIMVSTNLGVFEPTRAIGQAPAYPG